MDQETTEMYIKKTEREIELTEKRLDNVRNELQTATPGNVDELLEELTRNATLLGELDIRLGEEKKQLKKHLTTIEVTIPTSVVEKLDFIVSEMQKKEPTIGRNNIVSALIQYHYVDEGYCDMDEDEVGLENSQTFLV